MPTGSPPSSKGRRTDGPPSSWLRRIGRHGRAIGIVFLLLTVATASNLVRGVQTGLQIVPTLLILGVNLAALVLFVTIAYEVGVRLPRHLDDWDVALADRERLLDHTRPG